MQRCSPITYFSIGTMCRPLNSSNAAPYYLFLCRHHVPAAKLQGFARPINCSIPWAPKSKPRFYLFAFGKAEEHVA